MKNLVKALILPAAVIFFAASCGQNQSKDAKIPVVKIVDRTQAIEFALNEAEENDIILLAGKGHETYQIIGTEKKHYDEREVVRDLLANK